jgi:nucleoside-diphosphate-sugar epimerase
LRVSSRFVQTWSGRATLVTGGGGFIGGHLAVGLNRAGARVRVLCRYTSRASRGTLGWFDPDDVAGIEVVHGDLRDPESVEAAIEGVDTVFHLGAQIGIPYSFINARDFVETNIGGTLNVAQAAMRLDVSRLLHVSTSEVYGNALELPITEDHALAPRSPYAASKVGADMVMSSFHASFGLPVAIARPFNAYGPHQSARAVIPTIVLQALAGGTIRLGRPDTRRDFTFVVDTVDAMMAIAAADAAVGRVLHIGTGRDVSVSEIVGGVGEIVGRELPVASDDRRIRPGDSEVERLLCDASTTRELTWWQPSTDLRTGLERTVEWIEQHADPSHAEAYVT